MASPATPKPKKDKGDAKPAAARKVSSPYLPLPQTVYMPLDVNVLSYSQLELYHQGLRCFVWSNPYDGRSRQLLDQVSDRMKERFEARRAKDPDVQKPDLSEVTHENGDSGCAKLLPHMSSLTFESFQDPFAMVARLGKHKPLPAASPNPGEASVFEELAATIGDRGYGEGIPKLTRGQKDVAAVFMLINAATQFGVAKAFKEVNAPSFGKYLSSVKSLSFSEIDPYLGVAGLILGKDLRGLPTEGQLRILKREWPMLVGVGLTALTTSWLIQRHIEHRKANEISPLQATNATLTPALGLAGSLAGGFGKADSSNPLSIATAIVPPGPPRQGNLLPSSSVPKGYGFNLLGDEDRQVRGFEAHGMFNIARLPKLKVDRRVNAALWASGKHVAPTREMLDAGTVGRTDVGAGVHLGAYGGNLGASFNRSRTTGGATMNRYSAGIGYQPRNAEQIVQSLKFRAEYATIETDPAGTGDSVAKQLSGMSGLLQVGAAAKFRIPLDDDTALVLHGYWDVSAAQGAQGFEGPQLADVGGRIGVEHSSPEHGQFQIEIGANRSSFQPGVAGAPMMVGGSIRVKVIASHPTTRVTGFGFGAAVQAVEDTQIAPAFQRQLQGQSPLGTTSAILELEIFISPRTPGQRAAAQRRRERLEDKLHD